MLSTKKVASSYLFLSHLGPNEIIFANIPTYYELFLGSTTSEVQVLQLYNYIRDIYSHEFKLQRPVSKAYNTLIVSPAEG